MGAPYIYDISHLRVKSIRKYAWSDVSHSSIRFTYSSVARHIGPCICHNSQTYTWNDVIPYKGRMIRIFFYEMKFVCSSENYLAAFQELNDICSLKTSSFKTFELIIL